MSQESPEYFAILTAIGEAKDADAKAGGVPLKLTHMVVGDGAGATPSPELAQTQLVREVYRAPLNQLSLDPINTSQVIAECVIPEKSGGWWIREVGLLDADGDLVAVANCPPSYKPQMPEGSARTQVIRMVLIVSSAETVQLSIDPGIVMATRQYAEDTVLQKFSDLAEPSGAAMTGYQQAGNGARARKSEDKLRELVSITDFRGADPTGTHSSGPAVELACEMSPVAYVPGGKFRVDDTFRINGLWGPGELSVNGHRVRLPSQPRRESLISAVTAKLAGSSWTSGTMLLVADSIGEGYGASGVEHTWFDMLQKMLNVYVGNGSDPEITNLSDPWRYGLTYAGNYAIGTAGPVQRSLILQDGASVAFHGAYQYVDVLYEQAPGHGVLTMRRNGVPYRTIDTAGAVQNDVCTFPSDLSGIGPATDLYTLTASGGPVELTGIWRLVNTDQPAVFASRCALSAQSTQLFSQDKVIDSVVRHSRALNGKTGKPIIFVAICINNANDSKPDAGTMPEVYEAQLGKMLARYLNSDAYVIAIGGITPSAEWGSVRANYPAIAAAQKRVCEHYGVPLIAMDAFDWVRDGTVLADGLHPNDKGQVLMLDLVLDFLASPAFDIAGRTQGNCLHRYTPQLIWYGSGKPAANVGVANVRYYRQGPMCRVIGNLSAITPSDNEPSGPLTISLPLPSNTTVRSSGTVGYAHGVSVVGKAWSLQTLAGGLNVAVLRTINPETGGYEDVKKIDPDAMLDFDITYIVQD
ncbi:phage tail protein [Janthinobacterium sp. GB1R12]|uniref:phage tail-collar fiber domain-containing protein n=1 Tax=Janthinobacterium sp. GB1R12 TaxID=3424190 RepID=UPI003F243FDD